MTLARFTGSSSWIGIDGVVGSAIWGLPTEARATGPFWPDRTTIAGADIAYKESVDESINALYPTTEAREFPCCYPMTSLHDVVSEEAS